MNVLQTRVMGYPHLSSNYEAKLVVVLTEGQIHDKACYAGIVDFPNIEEVNDTDDVEQIWAERRKRAGNLVAASGSKLNYDNAKKYFPYLKVEEYRA